MKSGLFIVQTTNHVYDYRTFSSSPFKNFICFTALENNYNLTNLVIVITLNCNTNIQIKILSCIK